MQKITVKDALNLIKVGSLIIPKNALNSGREKFFNSGSSYVGTAQFPKKGLLVREIRIKTQNKYIGGSSYEDVPTSYELLFEGMPNNFYITHNEIDFEKSNLSGNKKDMIKRKIESIEISIEKHLDEIESRKEKIDSARGEIVRLKSKINLMNELGEELDDATMDAYLLVRKLRDNNGLTDLEVAKELAKFKG